MAERSQSLTNSVPDDEEVFYRTLEEYVQQVKLRYNLPIRLKFPRPSLNKNGSKSHRDSM